MDKISEANGGTPSADPSNREIRQQNTSIEAAYERFEQVGDPGIFIYLATPSDLTEPAELRILRDEERDPAGGSLVGVPFAVKDNIDVAGMPTTAACPAYAYSAVQDATVVARLKRAGAVPIGKTNLDQFATGLVGTRSPYRLPRNALDPELVPGGSSSGSAVAVATGIVPFALGTDTAGSGRVPAALNGIVGLKPSLGLLPSTGVVPACRTLDTVSVFARSVASAHVVVAAAAGTDDADPFSRPFCMRPPFAPERVRMIIPDAASCARVLDADVKTAFETSLERCSRMGMELVEIDFTPFFEVAELLYDGPWIAERHAVIADLLARETDAVLSVTREIIERAERFAATDLFRAIYRLKALACEVEAAMAGTSGLIVPSIPTWPTLDRVAADPFGPNARLGTFTNFVNLLDLCAVTVPAVGGTTQRPASLTVIARSGEDALAAALADRIHRDAAAVRGLAEPPSLPVVPEPVSGEVAVAVVGAHMAGLPLNHELTNRGGRFLRMAATANVYRLHALPGGTPPRPGLVRVETDGASIALEVWALPEATVGSFLQTVPAPLAIGTVDLSCGSTLKGFVCEAAGVSGAEDVTAYGGWRTYLTALRESGSNGADPAPRR